MKDRLLLVCAFGALAAVLSACGGPSLELGRDYHLDDADGRLTVRFDGGVISGGSVLILRNDGKTARQVRAELWSVISERSGGVRDEERLYVTRTDAPVPRDREGTPSLPFEYEQGQLVLGPAVIRTKLEPGREAVFQFGNGRFGGDNQTIELQWLDEGLERYGIKGGRVAGKLPPRAPDDAEAMHRLVDDYFGAARSQDVTRRRALELPASLTCIDKMSPTWFADELFLATPGPDARYAWSKGDVNEALDDPLVARLPAYPDAAIRMDWAAAVPKDADASRVTSRFVGQALLKWVDGHYLLVQTCPTPQELEQRAAAVAKKRASDAATAVMAPAP